MKIATASSIAKPKVGIATLGTHVAKPTPNVPAAPGDLPSGYDFCVTEGASGWFARYRDPTHPQHGSAVEVGECYEDQNGMMVCEVMFTGRSYSGSWGGEWDWSGGASGSAGGSWGGSWGGEWDWDWKGEWEGSAGGSGSGSGSTPRPDNDGSSTGPQPRPQPRPPENTPGGGGYPTVSIGRIVMKAPICDDPSADKEPIDAHCCVRLLDSQSAQIVCAGSAYDGLIVQIVTLFGDTVPHASVEHPDLPGGGARLIVCEPMAEIPEERPCCIEEETGMIVCPEGVEFSLAGQRVPLEYMEFIDNPDGMRVARIRCGDISDLDPSFRAENPEVDAMYQICEELGGYVFQVCERPKLPPEEPPELPPEEPPEIDIPKFPDICCYDPSNGRLVCEGTPYHDLPVNVIGEAVDADGRPIVAVQSERLPGGGVRVPLCPPPREIPTPMPEECCVVESIAGLTLVCKPSEHPYNGLDVTDLAKCYDSPEGRMCVVVFVDANGRSTTIEAPACPPPDDKIPPPVTGDIPPTPDPEYIPEPPPKIPPDSVPTRPPRSECDPEEWNRIVNAPKKLNSCDKKWLKMMEMFKENMGQVRPGRRYSGLIMHNRPKVRRYAYGGIKPENLENSTSPQFTKKRFPGLRGGRRTI